MQHCLGGQLVELGNYTTYVLVTIPLWRLKGLDWRTSWCVNFSDYVTQNLSKSVPDPVPNLEKPDPDSNLHLKNITSLLS